jgi:hypothetical protein
MDINGFREPQSPWFFTQPPTTLVDIRNSQINTQAQKKTLPTQDNRYPGWAAQMNDGRLITDYRSKCEANIPAGYQYATRLFMQRNADAIMSQSRKRQAQNTGAGLSYDPSTEMPADEFVKCDSAQCTMRLSGGTYDGVGITRVPEAVPELFGTFSEKSASMFTARKPSLTTVEEGGRNTVRGHQELR